MSKLTTTITNGPSPTQIPEPPLARFLFADRRVAWLWLIVRLYVAYQWLEAGWEKLSSPVWFGGMPSCCLSTVPSRESAIVVTPR